MKALDGDEPSQMVATGRGGEESSRPACRQTGHRTLRRFNEGDDRHLAGP